MSAPAPTAARRTKSFIDLFKLSTIYYKIDVEAFSAAPRPFLLLRADPPSSKGEPLVQQSPTSLWKSLERGDIVLLSRAGIPCHQGAIDDRTEDGRTIWVTDTIGHRRLFHIQDDYELTFPDAFGQ